jgi:hypothetical protein
MDNVLARTVIDTRSRPTNSLRLGRRFIPPILLLVAALALRWVASVNPEWVESYYSRSFYLNIAHGIAFINKFVWFSVAEILLLLILCGLIAGVIWQLRGLYAGRLKAGQLALANLQILFWVGSIGAMLFLIVWGLNYQRQPLAQSWNLPQRPVTSAELEMIGRTIVSEVNWNYEAGSTGIDPSAPSRLPLNKTELYEVLESSYNDLLPLLGRAAGGGFGPPKPVYLSRLMSRFSVSGIYTPFTGEPNFNTELPDSILPFALAHEMAHQRGYAREDEADFIAFVVCINASHRYVRYSGHLRSIDVLSVLARLTPQRYNEVVASLGPGPRADIDAANSFWLRHQGNLSQATYRVTDTYLKVNRVNSGMKNYGEVVKLIISYYLMRSG